jgi:hypothetical protein
MKSMARISLLAITMASLAVPVEAAPSNPPMSRTSLLGEVLAITARWFKTRAVETDAPSSLPQTSWGYIKAKYRNPDNPKGQ